MDCIREALSSSKYHESFSSAPLRYALQKPSPSGFVIFELLRSVISCASLPKSTESFCHTKTKPFGFQLTSPVPLRKYQCIVDDGLYKRLDALKSQKDFWRVKFFFFVSVSITLTCLFIYRYYYNFHFCSLYLPLHLPLPLH